jgi:hypothetical protein
MRVSSTGPTSAWGLEKSLPARLGGGSAYANKILCSWFMVIRVFGVGLGQADLAIWLLVFCESPLSRLLFG